MSKASSSFGRLSKRVWQSHSPSLSTKIQVYRAVVAPTLLYGAETWVPSEAGHATGAVSPTLLALHPLHQMARPRVERRSLKKSCLRSIGSILLQVQLRWAGHVTRMEDVRMPEAVFFSEILEEKHDRGAPRKRYKDQLKSQFTQAGISHQSWQHEASDRDSWRSSVRKASSEFEAGRHKAVKEKRRRQKERAASQSSSAQPFVCAKFTRFCAFRIGFDSHQPACKKSSTSSIP